MRLNIWRLQEPLTVSVVATGTFFNSEGLVKTTSIDLTHLYVLNTSSADSADWDTECISLANSQVDINFDFYSDDDGRNGINDDLRELE